MIRATMSKLGLLTECQWWAREEATWIDVTSPSASFGTAVHAFAEAVIEGREPPKTDDMALAAVCEKVAAWINANRRAGWRSEVAFAYHVQQDTAREIPRTTHRDYSAAGPADVCGTADLVYMAEDDEGAFACVDDFKWSGFHGDELRAQAQLAGLALCVSRAWGVERVRARAVRVSADGIDDTTEVHWLDAFDLGAMAAQVRLDVARIAQSEPRPGAHCGDKWCPAIHACPAKSAAMAQVIPDVALVRKDWRYGPLVESPDHLAWMLSIRPMLRKAMSQCDAAFDAYVKEGPVVTSGGEEIKQQFRTMHRLNMGALEQLARDKGATDEEIAGCYRQSIESNGIRVSGTKRGRAA